MRAQLMRGSAGVLAELRERTRVPPGIVFPYYVSNGPGRLGEFGVHALAHVGGIFSGCWDTSRRALLVGLP